MSESPDMVYGRLLESAHLSGYAFERVCAELEHMITDNRWREVGDGFTDINAFVQSIDLSAFNLGEKRPEFVRKIKALQPDIQNKSIAKMIDVSPMTVGRDLSPVTNVTPVNGQEAVPEESPITNVTPRKWFEESPTVMTKKAERDTKLANARAAKHVVLDLHASQALPPLTGEYDVIVLDPPWPVEFNARTNAPYQEGLGYARMTEEEITQIPQTIGLPMAADCQVWVWATQRFLPLAIHCLEAWGVRYVCTFVWDKGDGMKPMGLPRFTCEFMVYGRRGSPVFVDERGFDTVLHAARGEPSEKPDAFYDLVRRVTGGRRLDMFARRAIDGFEAWGWEAPSHGNLDRSKETS